LTYRILINCDQSQYQQEPDQESVDVTFSTLQVSRLETTPGLRTLANLPVINGLITSFLPSVILRIFLKLLPNLLGFMSHVQGMTSLSQVDFGVLRKSFRYNMQLVLFHA